MSRWLIVFSMLCLVSRSSLGAEPAAVRVATFNASLNRDTPGTLIADLTDPDDPQARNVAEIIQRVRPDILLLNEFDFDADGRSLALFRANYLEKAQNGAEPIRYEFAYSGPVNTGVPSQVDLDGDGQVASEPGSRGYGNDALGYGLFPGQYGMAILSRFPIDTDEVRTFGHLKWSAMPGALLPTRPDGQSWYSPAALAVLPVSSKNHWDVPVKVDGRVIHLLVSHPTPPAFDGPEDRNGRRNHDEIRLWADYISGGERAGYLGAALDPAASFILMGDQNADPLDGGSVPGAIQQLLDHPRVNAALIPTSPGASEASSQQGQANLRHQGPAGHDTSDFNDAGVGNLRVDYVLPSSDLRPIAAGVFWPPLDDPLARLVRMNPPASSDHRLVYVDLDLSEQPAGNEAPR